MNLCLLFITHKTYVRVRLLLLSFYKLKIKPSSSLLLSALPLSCIPGLIQFLGSIYFKEISSWCRSLRGIVFICLSNKTIYSQECSNMSSQRETQKAKERVKHYMHQVWQNRIAMGSQKKGMAQKSCCFGFAGRWYGSRVIR